MRNVCHFFLSLSFAYLSLSFGQRPRPRTVPILILRNAMCVLFVCRYARRKKKHNNADVICWKTIDIGALFMMTLH